MSRIRLLALAAGVALAASVQAGQYNKKLNVGDPAPSWSDLPGTDGKKHSLADLKDRAVVVVVFTCNSCPTAVGYEDRIIALAKKYQDKGVAVVAFNVNTIPEDKLDKMKERAKKKGFHFPYLYDESQKVARDFGASYTPEFFVLGRARKVVYMGAMDDRNDAKLAKENFLAPAIDAALKGERPAKGETLARGCLIRWKRVRD